MFACLYAVKLLEHFYFVATEVLSGSRSPYSIVYCACKRMRTLVWVLAVRIFLETYFHLVLIVTVLQHLLKCETARQKCKHDKQI